MEKLKETLNDLSLTNEEVKKLSEAFKKEEFRKLFREYAEELQDPENKRKYEEELTAMENERGMDVEFINPTSGHVLKTIQNNEKKVFINICQSDKIEKPSVNKAIKGDVRGATWSIPHSFSPPREDLDKKKESCLVYDVVFNTNTYALGTKNERFRKMLHDTTLEGIERMFKVHLDKVNFKILKLKMKGQPVSTVIRKKRADFQEKQESIKNLEGDPLQFPYPDVYETVKTEYEVKEKTETNENSEFVKPVYSIKYSNNFEIINFVGETPKQPSRPHKILLDIKLPLISSANCVDLDIEKNHLKLTAIKPVKYLLELKLTYPVLPDLGTAKFDKSSKTLKLELPIEQIPEYSQTFIENNDANVGNKLIEEQTHRIDMNENQSTEIPDLFNIDKMMSDTNKPAKVQEIERIVPQLNLKFRKNNSFCFLLCEIRNIAKESCEMQYDNQTEGEILATVNFSNCGQGGWKNFYCLPLIIKTKGCVVHVNNLIQCFVSEDNMVIRIQCQDVSSIAFLDQIFQCESTNYTCALIEDKSFLKNQETNNIEPTFKSVHGLISKDTLKIIFTPLDYDVDMEKEFPMISEEQIDKISESIEASEDELIELNDAPKQICQEGHQMTTCIDETMQDNAISDGHRSRQPISYSVNDIKPSELSGMQPTIISSDYFEHTRNSEHRTKCIVELNSNLLFDLE